jgi:hypothetical protein
MLLVLNLAALRKKRLWIHVGCLCCGLVVAVVVLFDASACPANAAAAAADTTARFRGRCAYAVAPI